MPRFRKKPVVIEAKQYADVRDATEIIDWALSHGTVINFWCADGEGCRGTEHELRIPTLEGAMHAKVGDWVIKGVQGEFYPCKPNIFNATYELVNDGEEG